MATIDDLGRKSLSEMTTDERLELLRQIRLQRLAPPKKATKTTSRKKPLAAPSVDSDQASKLLEILKGVSDD